MVQAAEIAGLVVVVAVIANAVTMFVFGAVRRSREASSQRMALKVFRSQAEVHLQAARRERDRVEHSWDGVRKFVVDRKVQEAEDVFSLYLKPHDRQALPPFEPGQHLTLRLRIPGQDRPLVRCYSLSDTPLEREHYRITVKKIRGNGERPDGVGSSHLAEHVQAGDILDVMAPSGRFCLDITGDSPAVLLAGGVGLTPLLSMLLTVATSGSRRELWLFYGVRNHHEHAMGELLRQICSEHDNIHLTVCYSDPTPDCRPGHDYDHAGQVTIDLLKQTLPSSNFNFFICGPPAMMDQLTAELMEWNVPQPHIHFEAFGPASAKTPKLSGAATAHEVVFARSGASCTWREGDGTILDLAESNGIVIESGCRAGSCGSCLTAVKEGEVEHTIEPGAPPLEGSCLTCIAQPTMKVVLDA